MSTSLLLVHGAWHTPAHYKPFTDFLATHLPIVVPSLPSCGQTAPVCGLKEDIAHVIQELHKINRTNEAGDAQPENIILLAHSYGGMVVTEALQQLFAYPELLRKIKHVVYIAAFMPQPGDSPLSISQPRPVPEPILPIGDGSCILSLSGRELFYNDVDDEALVDFCEKALVPHSLSTSATPATHGGWQPLVSQTRSKGQVLGISYIECLDDRVLFPHWQRGMIKAVEAQGVAVEVKTFDATSHSPFLSRVPELVDVVKEVASRYNV